MEQRVKRWYPVLEKYLPFIAHRLAAKVFFTPFRFKAPVQELEMADTANQFRFDHNGDSLQAYSWGQGPVVICCHGWSGRGLQFRKFVKPLVDAGFQVVCFDAKGHGRSPGKTSDVSAFSGAIETLASRYPSVHALVGHSLGGAACLFAIKNGLQVNGAVLISTPSVAPEIKDEFLRRIAGTESTGSYLDKYIIEKYGASLEEFSAKNSAVDLPDLSCLLIYDKHDQDVPIHHGEVLKEVLKQPEWFTTDHLGHTRILRSNVVIERTLGFIHNLK